MTSCPRSWEVEALRDGRLGGDARASIERHMEGCARCSAERRAFVELSTALRDASGEPDEVGLRRLRHRVLARAHRGTELVESRPRQRFVWLAASAIALVFASTASWFFLRGAPSTGFAVSQVDAPTEIEASPDAIWSRGPDVQKGHEIERIRIERGALRLHNPRPPNRKPLSLSVPDGEIEDLGTVFRVEVWAGRTTEIAVKEGRVLFHRASGDPVLIEAGEEWHPSTPVDPIPEAPSSMPSAVRIPVVALPPSSTTLPTRAASSAATTSVDTSATADASSQQEDAAYLHILALAREGRDDEARLAAIDYVRRFPNGFRRVEVEKIAKSTP